MRLYISRVTLHAGHFFRQHAAWLSITLVGVWALALYIHILRLPFFRDDMVMLLWLRDMPWGKLWIDATGFPYYRPLSFATLKLSELFFGYYQPQFLHAVNLFFHTANSVMIAMLARAVLNGRGRTLAGLSAGLLYAAYPFSFEIMPTTGPIFQLQAAFFALAACLAYAQWRRNTQYPIPNTQYAFRISYFVFRHRWLILSLLMALLGSFTCEYSVIIPPMVIATEIMLWWQSRTQSPSQPVAQSFSHPVNLATSNQLRATSNRPSGEPATHNLQTLISGTQYPIPNTHPRLTPLLYFVFTAFYLVIWLIVPKTRSTLPWFWLHDLGYKTLYYLQGLTYPLQPLALPLAHLLGLNPPTDGAALSGEWTWPAVALLAAIALAGLLIVFARDKRLDILAFGLAWWGIALAPMWPTLNWDYTWNGPRLHYIPALGTALLWGSAIGILTAETRRVQSTINKSLRVLCVSAVGSFLGLVLLAITLAPSVLFLRAQAQAVLAGGQMVDGVVRAVAAMPSDESALVVNFPSWISPARQMYGIGAEGLTFLPGYSTMADMVEINSRQKRNVTSVTFTNVWQPWELNQRFYTPPLSWGEMLPALHTASRVFEVEYNPGGLHFREAGAAQSQAAFTDALASFGGRVQLTNVDPHPQPLSLQGRGGRVPSPWWGKGQGEGQLMIALDWTSQSPVEADWTVFVHVYDRTGAMVAQDDGYPLLGLYPLWAWQPGESVHDIRYITLPPNLPPGRYRVGVGIYDRETGARVTATGPDGQRFADDVAPLLEFDN